MGGTAKYVAIPKNATTATTISPILRVRRCLANSPKRTPHGSRYSRDLLKSTWRERFDCAVASRNLLRMSLMLATRFLPPHLQLAYFASPSLSSCSLTGDPTLRQPAPDPYRILTG